MSTSPRCFRLPVLAAGALASVQVRGVVRMVTVCWSVKGGTGLSVVAAALALEMASPASDQPVLLVDLAGDAADILGQPDARAPGAADWLGAAGVPAAALSGLVRSITPSLALLPAGSVADVPPDADRLTQMAEWLLLWPGSVVVDAGRRASVRRPLLVRADRSVLVLRLCYLALQAASSGSEGDRPDQIVIVDEPGRSLTCGDVVAALGAPVVARVAFDPSISRAVDAGLLAARMPRLLSRGLRPMIDRPMLSPVVA